MLYLEHYEKALTIMSDPGFLEQELLLAAYHDPVYRTRPNYTLNGLHWGYIDNLVEWLNDEVPYNPYAYIVDGKHSPPSYQMGGFTLVKFKEIKDSIMLSLSQRIEEAKEREAEHLLLRKEKEEITIPLSFEGKEFLLVKYRDNYADEFDVNGFRIFTFEEWENWKLNLKEEQLHAGFGTNEACEYESKDDLLRCMKVIPISAEVTKSLFEVFGKPYVQSFGWNGRYHNKTIRGTRVSYGMFPDHLGDGEDD